MNTYDQLKEAVRLGIIPKEKSVAVSYRAKPSGRMGFAQCNHSVVWSPFFKTQKDAPWYDHECKTFTGKRAESVPLALAWASEQYGIEEWTGNAMQDKVAAIVAKKVPMKKT